MPGFDAADLSVEVEALRNQRKLLPVLFLFFFSNPLQRGIDLQSCCALCKGPKISGPRNGCADKFKGCSCCKCCNSCQRSILSRMRGNTDDEDSPATPLLGDDDAVVTIINSDNESPTSRSARRTKSTTDRIRNRNASLLGARRTPSNLFKNSNDTDTQNENSDVAFTIVVNRQADDDDAGEGDEEEDPDSNNNNRVEVDFVQEAVQEAIQEAVQDAVQEVVQDTVTEAVQEAVAAAFEENVRFDVRANFYTLIAITGVVLYWRGVWNSWDYCFGLSIWSETASVATGLVVMITMRYLQVPLVESLPGG